MDINTIKIIKKDGTLEDFKREKIDVAVHKATRRASVTLTDDEYKDICDEVTSRLLKKHLEHTEVYDMHNLVESVLEEKFPVVAKSYREYRNYKKDFIHMMDKVYEKSQAIRYIGDKENANTDSALVATKRSLIFNELNKQLYRKFFMTVEELQACRDGYIYVHDQSARLDTMNCFDESTRFITDAGVKSFYDFKDGDTVQVISHKGMWRNAVVHSYGYQEVQKVVLRGTYGDEKSIIVTPNHRWILNDNTETTELKVSDKLVATPYTPYASWVVDRIEKLGPNKTEVWCLEVEEDHSFLLEDGIPTGNCCLFDIEKVMTGGFEMGNIWYNEPNSLDTAFDVIGDIVLSTAAQQYGGFTVPEIDKVLEKYAEKSYNKYVSLVDTLYKLMTEFKWVNINDDLYDEDELKEMESEWADHMVERDFEQGFQGIEYKLNTVGSSRGDYPFVTMSFGLATSKFGRMASKTFLRVHRGGQGKKDNKKPVLFPKLVFLYDENIHGAGRINEDVFDEGILCSSQTMYPDWLSMSGDGYIASMYKKYGRVVSPMGCRAFLSPWYERGGEEPADENDKPVFTGRFNIGAVSLHLPMILAKSRKESKDFYEVLDYYLELIRQLHIRTYEYLGEMKASTNPLAYCEGGFYGGNLKPHEKIKPILKAMTASFGITAFNELQMLYNGKSLVEDGQFALDTLKHINEKINQYKKEDHILYALYSTPGERLCFSGDSKIQGERDTKMIKNINVGDMVYTYNDTLKCKELKKVIATECTDEHSVVVKVTTDNNNQSFTCTLNHPIAVKTIDDNIEYIEAEKLEVGNILVSSTENDIKVVSVEVMEDLIPVYNIEVEDNHNYFVGDYDGILVHNCGLQIEQFRKKYGIIDGVSSRAYVSNSFHCGVWEDIEPTHKQDLEHRFWELSNGGKIQYVKYPLEYNIDAVKTLIKRAMAMGFYEGVNLSLAYCEDCGHQELNMDVCPVCGSRNLTKIERMNGYLSYSRVHGDTRLNDAKMAEIAERKSM